MMRRLTGYLVLALSLAACVTINIYFPAAAAEEAARTIVRDVLNEGGDTTPVEPQTPAPANPDDQQGRLESGASVWLVALESVVNVLVPPAQAAPPNIAIDSPAIRGLRASMTNRQADLAPFYRSGALGFTQTGTVAVRDLKSVPLPERNKVKKLVADENGDRQALYAEIARANGHPEWTEQIRQIFAKVWVEEAPKGYWHQDAKGGWQQK
ncbi:MAG: YdbL family protein [Candidatus Thiodiazotropha sp.]